MKTNLKMPGISTSKVEVTMICDKGFWFLIKNKEYFVPFEKYPDFQNATVEQIYNVDYVSPTQFYWSNLDVDIELDALEQPEKFPLIFTK